MAYTRDIKYTTIEISKAGVIYVQFGIVSISFIGFALIQIPIGQIGFYIIIRDTFFLLFFTKINQLNIYFNNIDNLLVIKIIYILVIRYIDYLFLLWKSCLNFFITQSFYYNPYYLMETKLPTLQTFQTSFCNKTTLTT